MKKKQFVPFVGVIFFSLACSLSFLHMPQDQSSQPLPTPTAQFFSQVDLGAIDSNTTRQLPTNTHTIVHITMPTEQPEQGKLIYDVESSITASEKRAPYGDSLKINRFERPFFQDMTYIPDLDIVTYNVSQDETWIYVSIELVGSNPNNPLGIYYGIELDLDVDGFGNYIIWAHPPYGPDWTTDGVQVFADTNHDTGGLSSQKSDIPFDGDGYETLIFDAGIGDDPDLAWVRASDDRMATIQFAFKTSLAGSKFMLGVVADAGIKDVTKFDYNDRFTEEQAGSPEKSEEYYPLNAIFAVDNACRVAIGFEPSGNEPQGCPRDEPLPGGREADISTPISPPPVPPSLPPPG